MKKLIIILLLTFLINNSGQSGRIITSFDIARWYLDSDLVIICTVNQIDTMNISSYDSLMVDSIHLKYEIIREKYGVTIDSIVKTKQTELQIVESFMTPDFAINYSKSKVFNEKEFGGLDSKDDSIFVSSMQLYSDYDDDSGYFRLQVDRKKHLVILTKSLSGFVIDFQTVCDDSILKLIGEINVKGESYFRMD
jgi:hypothetical protein